MPFRIGRYLGLLGLIFTAKTVVWSNPFDLQDEVIF